MKIKYYFNELIIWLFLKYEIPQKWNELSFWQLKMIGRILHSNSQLEKKYFQQLIVVILSMRKPSVYRVFKTARLFLQVPSLELIPYSNFIISENDRLTIFPEKIKVGSIFHKKILFGPGIRLNNITVEELSYADTFFYNWITEGRPEDLQRLTACLYRPSSLSQNQEDLREPFNRLLLPKNAVLTDKIPPHIQYIIALAYQGSRETLMDKFKHVFPKPKVSEEEVSRPKKKKPYMPFSKIINAMAMDETQVFGTLQQTEKTNAVKFLEIYEETIIQSNKRK